MFPASGSQFGSADGLGVAVAVGQPDRRDGAPELIAVLGVVEGDRRVGDAQVQGREEPRRGGQVAWLAVATVWAIWFQKFWIGGAQNLPITV